MSVCRKRALPHRKSIFVNRKCILLPDLLLCPVLVYVELSDPGEENKKLIHRMAEQVST